MEGPLRICKFLGSKAIASRVLALALPKGWLFLFVIVFLYCPIKGLSQSGILTLKPSQESTHSSNQGLLRVKKICCVYYANCEPYKSEYGLKQFHFKFFFFFSFCLRLAKYKLGCDKCQNGCTKNNNLYWLNSPYFT